MMCDCKCKLSAIALGLAFGIVWGASMFVMGLTTHYLDYGTVFVSSMGALYIGYDHTLMGSLIGALYGFIDAFLGGILIGYFYNWFSRCCKKKQAESCCHKDSPQS